MVPENRLIIIVYYILLSYTAMSTWGIATYSGDIVRLVPSRSCFNQSTIKGGGGGWD